MSYIKQNLNKNEKLENLEKPSAKPVIIFFVLSTLGILFSLYESFFGGPKIDLSNPDNVNYSFYGWLVFIICIGYSIKFYIDRFINEYGISNQRVVSKSGFISRDIEEMSLKSIESVNVKQSILGRILNYGSIIVTGRGNATITFKDIDNPTNIRKKIQNNF